jgi:site-specific recombinase XerD
MSAAPVLRSVPGGVSAWDSLMHRDEWRMDEVPNGDLSANHRGDRQRLRFERISQPVLRHAAKCWARDRLAGSSFATVVRYITSIAFFSEWLVSSGVAVRQPGELTREQLMDYHLHVTTSELSKSTQEARIGDLKRFIEEQRTDGLRGISVDASYHRNELPRHRYRPSLAFDDTVFAQLRDEAKLALLPQHHRTAVALLSETGMRISSIITLDFDPIHYLSRQPCIRFFNVKQRRERLIPISDGAEREVRRQQEAAQALYPDGTRFLFPPPKPWLRSDKNRTEHMTPCSVSRALKTWVDAAGIRDARGEVPRIFPHAFRHTVGSSMINEGVPLHVVQSMLDHSSPEMTSHYARISDRRLRDEWERWMHTRVDIRGEGIAFDPAGMSEAEWMRESLARAKRSLPNGLCGLPLVQECPHPNACLSCSNFITDATFKPVHEQQLADTRELIQRAEASGQQRQLENLRRDEGSLVRILDGLATLEDLSPSPAEDNGDFSLLEAAGRA